MTPGWCGGYLHDWGPRKNPPPSRFVPPTFRMKSSPATRIYPWYIHDISMIYPWYSTITVVSSLWPYYIWWRSSNSQLTNLKIVETCRHFWMIPLANALAWEWLKCSAILGCNRDWNPLREKKVSCQNLGKFTASSDPYHSRTGTHVQKIEKQGDVFSFDHMLRLQQTPASVQNTVRLLQ